MASASPVLDCTTDSPQSVLAMAALNGTVIIAISFTNGYVAPIILVLVLKGIACFAAKWRVIDFSKLCQDTQ